jgi:putative endonuclease
MAAWNAVCNGRESATAAWCNPAIPPRNSVAPRKPIDRIAAGQEAETAASTFLQSQQMTILARNYRCRTGELDIIAKSADGIVIIAEVRLRSRCNYGGGAASVDWRKQRKIQRATRHLLATHPDLARSALRFDVLDLQPAGSGFSINWIRHAFSA